jgi:hypothetical protein
MVSFAHTIRTETQQRLKVTCAINMRKQRTDVQRCLVRFASGKWSVSLRCSDTARLTSGVRRRLYAATVPFAPNSEFISNNIAPLSLSAFDTDFRKSLRKNRRASSHLLCRIRPLLGSSMANKRVYRDTSGQQTRHSDNAYRQQYGKRCFLFLSAWKLYKEDATAAVWRRVRMT